MLDFISNRDPGDEDDGEGRFMRSLTREAIKGINKPGMPCARTVYPISWLSAVRLGLWDPVNKKWNGWPGYEGDQICLPE